MSSFFYRNSYGTSTVATNMQYFATSAGQDMWTPNILTTVAPTVEEYDSSKLPSFHRFATNSGFVAGGAGRTTTLSTFNAQVRRTFKTLRVT